MDGSVAVSISAKTGVSVRALRYHEEQQPLASKRSPSGQRTYPESAVERDRLIQQLYGAGLPSRQIVELLPCVKTAEMQPELLDWLVVERDRINRQISDLVSTRDRLDDIIGRPPPPGARAALPPARPLNGAGQGR
ncbi:MerR family transcriptional regulator [Saccharopolyspora pogona]|uniref:MerR family transcriptional regulator n=1 Tax=Saccharopolyspora pogona TaxID=333966 RepID=UPI001CC24B13|nr:MerR family transcriptional regulator [Saccharopolyspora pogona]